VRWATGTLYTCANTGSGCQAAPSLPLPRSLPTATELAHCHTARERYIARQQYTACPLLHSSLMVYRSPTVTVYQLPQSLPTVHSLPIVTQLANGVQITNYHSFPTATELANCRRALPTVHNLPTATQLTNGMQLTNYHATRFPIFLSSSTPSFPLQVISVSW
jgi:hypothetical protein